MLTDSRDVAYVANSLQSRDAWRPFPKSVDREQWLALPDAVRARLIAAGEARLGQRWEPLPASLLLDFVRTGSRETFQKPQAERRQRLVDLVLAECVEGGGRFVEAIADGVWALCEESFWGYPAHLFMQKAGPGLPDVAEPIVDLGVGEVAALLAWTDYLLEDRLDSVSPLLRPRMRQEVDRRMLSPCLSRDDFWWMGWDRQGHPVNNWNPWIVSNWLAANLLLETDPGRRARAAHKAMRVLDVFIDDYPADGGCDEGPVYWTRAAASLFDALEWLHSASGGRISIYDQPLIAEMGRYLMRAHIHDKWFINFADASATGRADGTLVHRFGRRVGDPALAAFGAWLHQRDPDRSFTAPVSLGRILPALFALEEVAATPPAAPLLRDVWLPDLQVMAARDTAGSPHGFYVAAKGGHNAESHNHNDVGAFLAYLDGWPLFIDLGVETYTAKTFSPQRYEIWTMQSGWHNLPVIEGIEQRQGREFAARDVAHAADDSRAVFSLDLAPAYPGIGNTAAWRRTITLERGRALEVRERFRGMAAAAPNAFHFITTRPVDTSAPGRVRLGGFPGTDAGRGAALAYDAARLGVVVDRHEVTDALLTPVWGGKVFRIRFTAREAGEEGDYVFRITALEP